MNINVLSKLSYGMYIISSRCGERLVGCTINTAMQVASQPAIISVCVNKSNFTNECIKQSGIFALSILSEEASAKTIGIFGFQSSKTVDKFAAEDYQLLADGLPVLQSGACAYLSCRVVNSIEIENYNVFFGEVIAAETLNTKAKPMTYDYYHSVIKGKAPATAPTFIG